MERFGQGFSGWDCVCVFNVLVFITWFLWCVVGSTIISANYLLPVCLTVTKSKLKLYVRIRWAKSGHMKHPLNTQETYRDEPFLNPLKTSGVQGKKNASELFRHSIVMLLHTIKILFSL